LFFVVRQTLSDERVDVGDVSLAMLSEVIDVLAVVVTNENDVATGKLAISGKSLNVFS
jgi:predicted amino acid-binding ACT domain protein